MDKEELGHFHQKWADILAEMNDYAGSAEKYLDAAALQTDGMKRFQDYWRAGRSFYMTGRREEASKYAGMALKILAEEGTTPEDYMSHPNYAPIRMGWMGWIELALGNKEKAKQYFEKMEQINPCGGADTGNVLRPPSTLGSFITVRESLIRRRNCWKRHSEGMRMRWMRNFYWRRCAVETALTENRMTARGPKRKGSSGIL